ncbi:MAG: glutamine-hydrolyzing carbamoyl-phosphate synthase small subunit [Sphingomonadaceae bacterium]|uniref:glutamine-hydrolyzing carbamoyl-phosphate synthase small subunit n=1 Tax=Thermaurantiacus sp. TaxID=2820283 RepID=UPI00298F3422|nr:glutamine-hydrolyzing carbamoyl-phosphate synthase small subunit [Thermaurantiacus sp.]MCS6986777.1 glutamine-hydrolyzing carbamoyl-phosphate synthase small subunit [Sphingomonadaceae bacterium]MDW8413960.1 glutamine-hydrolyzing carbamoyl-phosphate synthase small subunit [Thermaurantiacus sp.]
MPCDDPARPPAGATGLVALADGTLLWGQGFGAEGEGVGELCFNTAMTGYQEVLTDPSYAGQIVTFTFPHIGNVGTNPDDEEAGTAYALGCVVAWEPTAPSSWRALQPFASWLAARGLVGVAGIDTRALTRRIRRQGAPNAVIAHRADGRFDIAALIARARAWPGLNGMDLALQVSTRQTYRWVEGPWVAGEGHAQVALPPDAPRIVVVDYGVKRAILRQLVGAGAQVTVVPATAGFDDVMTHAPDGLFLSNGPGDPAATAAYALPLIQRWLDTGRPLFGICLGHQLLALAVGARTLKMHQGHRGANHPVKRLADGAVEITSMNHGFAVDAATLPAGVRPTHVSLFDGSNCGLELVDRPAFSVQYHPEASPGPQDSHHLFRRFVDLARAR